jgi:hypothetical protein
MRVFGIIRDAMSFIIARPGVTVGFTALTAVPMALNYLSVAQSGLLSFLTQMAFILVYMACLGGAAAAASHDGDSYSTGDCLRLGFGRLPTYFLLVLLLILCAIGVVIVFGLVTAAASMAAGGVGVRGMSASTGAGLAIVVVSLAFSAFCLFLYVSLCLTVPACVMEDLGVMASLRRSMELTRGSRFKIFLTFLLLGLITVPVMIWAGYSELNAVTMAAEGGFEFSPSGRYQAISIIVYLIGNTFTFAIISVIYAFCTAREEGTRLEDYSQVF